MKILHLYQKSDSMVTAYVDILIKTVCKNACDMEMHAAANISSLKNEIRLFRPDILHIHGCWSHLHAAATRMARKNGIRTVVTPHGQMEPWIIKQRYWKEKLPKLILFQRKAVKQAYAIIVFGRMEEECFRQMNLNPRIETVRNCLITQMQTPENMAAQTLHIYRKIADSNVTELFSRETSLCVKAIIHAGITGNRLWLENDELAAVSRVTPAQWRQIMIYAFHEDIIQTIQHGIDTLQLFPPEIHPEDIECYLPHPMPEISPADGGTRTEGTPTETAARMIMNCKRLTRKRKLAIKNIIDLAEALQTWHIEEDKLKDMLEEQKAVKFAASMMNALNNLTGLKEGHMPVTPADNRMAKAIIATVNRRLAI